MHRVQKLLSNYGYCSRRKAEELIIAGRVKVNGKVIGIGDKASVSDKISVDEKVVSEEKKRYIVFNKPVKCVTAVNDPKYKTVMDYIKIKERVFPIGRLDYYTSGLLILTNDGDLANKVMHPRYEIEKTYRVKVDKEFKHAKQVSNGVMLEDGKTAPAKVKLVASDVVDITIHEGKNRIVRRMMEKLGYRIRTLERIKVGGLGLMGLKAGEYKLVSKSKIVGLVLEKKVKEPYLIY